MTSARKLSRPGKTALIATLLLWSGFTFLVVFLESRPAGSDVFLFKEAGSNLASKGKFVAANLIHMPPDTEFPFAFYPPLFPLFFGFWSSVFGIGIKQSLLFENLLRLFRTIALGMLIWPSLRSSLADKTKWKRGAGALGVLLLLSLVSTDSDRADELAICFGLLSWFVLRKEKSWKTNLMGGLLLGLTASTSPAAGAFFGMGTLLILFLKKDFKGLVTCEILAVLTFICAVLPPRLQDPEAHARFMKQASVSTFPYRIPFVNGTSLQSFWESLQFPIRHWIGVPGLPYFLCFLALFGLSVYGRRTLPRRVSDLERLLLLFPLAFAPLSFVIWSLQPYYLWFGEVCLVAGLLAAGLALPKKAGQYLFIGVVLSLLPILKLEIQSICNAWERPATESSAAIQREVLSSIPESARLAVTADQYFTFRKKREISNVAFVCNWLDRYDYVYVTPAGTSRISRENPLPIPCEPKRHCFHAVKDTTSKKELTLFGHRTGYYVRGNGGTLYQNTECRSKIGMN